MHRRKSSREEDNAIVTFPNGSTSPTSLQATNHAANAVNDHTETPRSYPPSAGPYRTSFVQPSKSPTGVNGPSFARPSQPHGHAHAHAHTRNRSISYAPASPSPLSPSFSSRVHVPPSPSPSSQGFSPSPSFGSAASSDSLPPTTSREHARRHSRIHSRNLSIFFPRPGSLPTHTIAEDGTQELELGVDGETTLEAPVMNIPHAPPSPEMLRSGFKFGGRQGDDGAALPANGTPTSASSHSARRGHHHKHSLSHNFFSFLEPGNQTPAQLHTTPTPTPISPWNPISPFPDTQTNGSASTPASSTFAQAQEVSLLQKPLAALPTSRVSPAAAVSSLAQFVLGAWMWVAGQQNGSLACTGLGYWIVFDAFGIALAKVLPGYLARKSMQSKTRRPYGNARVETVFLFAQTVYLIFASVYVCKETVEHLLLSAGEGHHHHSGDEEINLTGIPFPIYIVFLSLLSLVGSALAYNTHSKLVNTTGNQIPSLSSYIQSLRSRFPTAIPSDEVEPAKPISRLLSNPYSISPIGFSVAILYGANFLLPHQHRAFDLLLALGEAFVTFSVAYPAAVALGAVLLQISPARGLADGRMEAFLRAMREVERHPKVLHLPAPHIWQLTPSLSRQPCSKDAGSTAQSLVVTLELHVRRDMDDADVLELTRWAHERCKTALRIGRGRDADVEPEVTVGVVRG
ncbi:hypothetical protein PUNSTDRAFT_96639 [Punctularia strigosozonata HHB-11173 SS5]|uniref:uncharacterized protein n=1 Tax=Punctularia strigosozonata (strain HHB-11173) TaxID=741275 RepID=UPI0004417F69|nr:uncharacterized protein PUNSTDRAFT_96639 [Punctularia strigosozonata HHB-11173 SS5]EIN14641.1 hypothetical protein PUNSTDRAFT_96639 [Punctularia strigosozonata HHB-11173 SS5]